MTVNERIQSIIAQGAQVKEQRMMARLQTEAGMNEVLITEDKKLIKSIVDRIVAAQNRPLARGFMFSDTIETLVAIARALTYAKKEVRELLEPSSPADLDLYDLFDRDTCEQLMEAYGQLPYNREPTILTMPDGTIQVLDAERVEDALKGKHADVDTLNNVIESLSLRLGLYADHKASKAQADRAFAQAKRSTATVAQLKEYEAQLEG